MEVHSAPSPACLANIQTIKYIPKLLMNIKRIARRKLDQSGWYLRKLKGLSVGTNLWIELWRDYGDCITGLLDVGAHRGETVDQVHEVFPQCPIHAFEPVKSNFEVLSQRYDGVSNVRLYHTALGATEGEVEIVLQHDSQTHSLRHVAAAEAGQRKESIRVMTLDGWVKSSGKPEANFLKIDTEGFEMEVLRGGESLLRSGAINWIVCEATLDPDDNEHTQLNVLTTHLSALGYRLAGLYDQTQWQKPCRLSYFNALFKRAE